MSTALIMFSVFLTGAIATRRDAAASNTLMVFALLALLAALGLWGYAYTLR